MSIEIIIPEKIMEKIHQKVPKIGIISFESERREVMTSHELKEFEASLNKGDEVSVRMTDRGVFISSTGVITRVGTKSVRVALNTPVFGRSVVRVPLFTNNNAWSVNHGVFPVSEILGTSVVYGGESADTTTTNAETTPARPNFSSSFVS